MICISIKEPNFEACKKALQNVELAEIRMDEIGLNDSEIKELFASPVSLIATCRPGKIADKDRLGLLKKAIEAGADYVDIELEAPDNFKEDILQVAKNNDCKIIISYHNHEKTPSKRELEETLDWCFDSRADIAKIACMVNSNADNSRILSLYDTDRTIVAIGMGEKGKLTRIAAPLLGAPFTYASVSPCKETAEGQMDVDTMKNILETLKNV